MVGRVIGRGGETIKGLQTATGARVQIDQTGMPCTVTITGSPYCVDAAVRSVSDIINGGSTAHYQVCAQPRSDQIRSDHPPPPPRNVINDHTYPPTPPENVINVIQHTRVVCVCPLVSLFSLCFCHRSIGGPAGCGWMWVCSISLTHSLTHGTTYACMPFLSH